MEGWRGEGGGGVEGRVVLSWRLRTSTWSPATATTRLMRASPSGLRAESSQNESGGSKTTTSRLAGGCTHLVTW